MVAETWPSTVAALGFLTFRSLTTSRVLALLIALRGTRPEERPQIIHALNAAPEPRRKLRQVA